MRSPRLDSKYIWEVVLWREQLDVCGHGWFAISADWSSATETFCICGEECNTDRERRRNRWRKGVNKISYFSDIGAFPSFWHPWRRVSQPGQGEKNNLKSFYFGTPPASIPSTTATASPLVNPYFAA